MYVQIKVDYMMNLGKNGMNLALLAGIIASSYSLMPKSEPRIPGGRSPRIEGGFSPRLGVEDKRRDNFVDTFDQFHSGFNFLNAPELGEFDSQLDGDNGFEKLREYQETSREAMRKALEFDPYESQLPTRNQDLEDQTQAVVSA